MTKILEYITLNYTWFLGGAILILLAIIGYYADKTNFGQGKPKKDDDNNKSKDNDKALEENRIEPVEFEDSEVEEEKVEDSTIDDSLNLVDPLQIETNNQISEEQPIQEEGLTSDNANLKPQNENINEEPYSEISSNDIEQYPSESVSNDNNIDTNNLNDVTNNIENTNTNEEVIVEQPKPKVTKKKKMKQIDTKKLDEIRKSLMEQKSEINEELNKDNSKSDAFSAFDDEFNSLVPKKDILENDLLSDIQDIKLDKPKKKKKELKDVPDLDNVELPKIRKMESSKKDVWKK